MKIEFTYLTKISASNAVLESIRVFVDVELNQSIRDGGIVCDLSLSNQSSEDISIRNPLDSLQIALQNYEGWPMKLPLGSAPRILVNSSGPVERPFKVVRFSSTPEDRDLMDKIDDLEFVLESNTTYTFTIVIDQVQDIDPQNFTAISSKTKPLPSGKYTMSIKLPLLLSEYSTAHMLCSTEPIQIEFL